MDNRINDVEQLRRFCMKKDINEIGEYLEKNYGAKFVDEWIDDGTEEEGVYVNGVAYRFPNGGIIDFFFGSDDRIISYVDTRRMKRLRENKQTVRLNEKQLRKVVAESVKKVLKEGAADYDMSPEAVSVRNGNLRGEPQYINPQNIKTDIEQLIHYLMGTEGDSPRAQKAYQKALKIKQDIFNKIDLISKGQHTC